MKLELKHLVGYLPYGLDGYHFTYKKYWAELVPGNAMWFIESTDFMKIVLHPLSDLTKEIEIGGEKFVPIDVFFLELGGGYFSKNGFTKDFVANILLSPIDTIAYGIVKKLYEWHFDIHNLIGEGLAIDINTLKS